MVDLSSIFGNKKSNDNDDIDVSDINRLIASGKAMPGPAASRMESAKPAPQAKPASAVSKSKYICVKCGYKFSLDPKGYKKIDCPWCGTQQPIQ